MSPDAVTLIGTAGVVAGALVFFPRGEFFWGTIVITLFVFSDLVDGNMARQLGPLQPLGRLPRLHARPGRRQRDLRRPRALVRGRAATTTCCAPCSIFCLASGQVVSYTKARGEAIGLPVTVNGLVERAERLVISLVAAGLAGLHAFGVPGIDILLPIALWIVAVGSLVTLGQRVVTVRRESAEADAASGGRRRRAREAAA